MLEKPLELLNSSGKLILLNVKLTDTTMRFQGKLWHLDRTLFKILQALRGVKEVNMDICDPQFADCEEENGARCRLESREILLKLKRNMNVETFYYNEKQVSPMDDEWVSWTDISGEGFLPSTPDHEQQWHC